MTILVTGGAGYIGSHTCAQLIEAGYDVVIIDNLSNSSFEVVRRIKKITGKAPRFYEGDIRDSRLLDDIFTGNQIDAVIHFAGLKAVAESISLPLQYYENNVAGSLSLFKAMQKHGVKKMVFSSSATVYGIPETVPIHEDFPRAVLSPYGRTKLMIEDILNDLYNSDSEWGIILLRYFNPIGAHESGLIGEAPNGIPNNLMPFITQVAVGKLEELEIFGDDYPTRDGTCVRDYIHVLDLACGHLNALEKVSLEKGVFTYNLGTGNGYSVLELISAFERATGITIPRRVVERRPGDAAECYADASKARRELHWQAQKSVEQMCADSWRWQKQNPFGYETDSTIDLP